MDLTAQKEVKATTDEERAAQAAAARNKILKRIAIGVGLCLVFGHCILLLQIHWLPETGTPSCDEKSQTSGTFGDSIILIHSDIRDK